MYFLKKIDNHVLQDPLFKLMSSTNNINYFVFNDLLVDLVDSKLVSRCNRENDVVFQITTDGENSYELTKDLVPGILKLKADTVFDNEYAKIENEFSIVSEFIPQNENEYMVTCKIVENTETIFEITTCAGSREIAQTIVDNWNTNANRMYPRLLNILTKIDS